MRGLCVPSVPSCLNNATTRELLVARFDANLGDRSVLAKLLSVSS